MHVTPEHITAYAAVLESGDRRAVIRAAVEHLERGMSLGDFVLGVLAPAQVRVCERAARENRLTPAFQQVAIDVADTVLGVAAARTPAGTERGRIVVCVTEREHQNLPARVLCELLRADGYHVTFLGRPTTTPGVSKVLQELGADALLLSCSLPMNLPCVPQLAAAAHRVEVPVIAGGHGFGPDPVRAERLGADRWAGRLDDVGAAICDFGRQAPDLRLSTAEHAQQQELTAIRRQLTEELADRIEFQNGHMLPRGPRSRRALRADLHNVLLFLEAAVLCDERILADYAGWLTTRALEQHAHPRLVPTLISTVEDRLVFDLPAVAAPLQAARAQAAIAA